jgi:adenylylsulfate kinase
MAKVFWLTGLSGAGKSSLCELVLPILTDQGLKVKILDGDVVRSAYPRVLGFELKDVIEGNLHVSQLAAEFATKFDVILVPVIAPYEEARSAVRSKLMDNLRFIYCSASIEVVRQRDVKGLYRKADLGEITNMIGLSDRYPYEVPLNPDFCLDTSKPIHQCVSELIEYITHEVKISLKNPGQKD